MRAAGVAPRSPAGGLSAGPPARGGAAAAMLVPGPGGAEPHMGPCLAGGGAEAVSAQRLPAPAHRPARSALGPDGGGACCFPPRCPQVSAAAARARPCLGTERRRAGAVSPLPFPSPPPSPRLFPLRRPLPLGGGRGRGARAVNGRACSGRAALTAARAQREEKGVAASPGSGAKAGGRPPPAWGRCRRGGARRCSVGGRAAGGERLLTLLRVS